MNDRWQLFKEIAFLAALLAIIGAGFLAALMFITITSPSLNTSLALAQFQAQSPLALVRTVGVSDSRTGIFQLKVGNRDAVGHCLLVSTDGGKYETKCLPFTLLP